MIERLSEYRIMWLFVFFDLPTETKNERKAAADFRKRIVADGFFKFQFSVYLRHCPSRENAEVHIQRVKNNLPAQGQVGILRVTDKQFGEMILFSCSKKQELPQPVQQLVLF